MHLEVRTRTPQLALDGAVIVDAPCVYIEEWSGEDPIDWPAHNEPEDLYRRWRKTPVNLIVTGRDEDLLDVRLWSASRFYDEPTVAWMKERLTSQSRVGLIFADAGDEPLKLMLFFDQERLERLQRLLQGMLFGRAAYEAVFGFSIGWAGVSDESTGYTEANFRAGAPRLVEEDGVWLKPKTEREAA